MTRECENCGEVLEDESLFCPKCGNYVKRSKEKRKYPIKWIAVAALVIVIVAAAAIFISGNDQKTDTRLTMNSTSHSPEEYVVQLTDENGKPLADRFIEVGIGNDTYTLRTDSNGTARMNLTLDEGTFEIRSHFSGDEGYSESRSSDIVVI